MNLKQLEYFVTAAELLNFTRAAERCYISQTAMTQQIHSLEKELEAVLFLRDKHHVELTGAGKVFLQEARAILMRSEAARRLVKNAQSETKGKLTIGFIRGYGQSDLAKLLAEFHKQYPGITLELIRENEHGLLCLLDSGDCDLAFAVTPYSAGFSNLVHHHLKNYPLMVVLPAEHHLADKPYLSYKDLKEEEFILMQPASRLRAETEESRFILEQGGFIPNVAGMEADPETLLLMVSIGIGISILPEYVISHSYTRQDLKILPLVKSDNSAENLEFELLWKEDHHNPAIEKLLEIIRKG